MKLALCLTLALTLLASGQASFVVFGDSFTDSGHGANPVINAALSTDQMDVGTYPPAPYYLGRFSNGPTWVEYAAAVLGQKLTNLATGNAASGAVPGAFTVEPHFGYLNTATMVPVPSSYQQAMAYAALHGNSVNPNDYYFVFIGSNDLVYTVNGVANASNAGITNYINMTMQAVYAAGARKFVVLNIPPLNALPMFSPPYSMGSMSSNAINYLSSNIPTLNGMISTLVEDFPMSNPGSTVLSYDVYSFFENVTSNAATYGFTDTTTPCYLGPTFFADITGEYNYSMCSNPTQHVFWDVVHPTKAFHAVFGQMFVEALGDQLTANAPASTLAATPTASVAGR